MSTDIAYTFAMLVTIPINYAIFFIALPLKYSLRFSVIAVIFYTVALQTLFALLGIASNMFGGFRGLVHLPMMMLLFRSQFPQKLFAVFMVMTFSGFLLILANIIAEHFAPQESDVRHLITAVLILLMLTIYVTLAYTFGKSFLERLFNGGQKGEWILYSLGALVAFSVLMFANNTLSGIARIVILCFTVWSFAILCFSIINAHEKARQASEANFARDIVSSGREHYQKMDEMYGKLRILRHNYKYHLTAISELLRSGSMDELRQYLQDAETEFAESELTAYCQNTVINALLVSYSERCAKLDIRYDAEVAMPDNFSVPNYDICIIVGNLLENAVEACQKQTDIRTIDLLIKPAGAQIIVKVKNSFHGMVVDVDGKPQSTKPDGGLGLRSIQAVVDKHGGELITEWDTESFTAYVLVGL